MHGPCLDPSSPVSTLTTQLVIVSSFSISSPRMHKHWQLTHNILSKCGQAGRDARETGSVQQKTDGIVIPPVWCSVGSGSISSMSLRFPVSASLQPVDSIQPRLVPRPWTVDYLVHIMWSFSPGHNGLHRTQYGTPSVSPTAVIESRELRVTTDQGVPEAWLGLSSTVDMSIVIADKTYPTAFC